MSEELSVGDREVKKVSKEEAKKMQKILDKVKQKEDDLGKNLLFLPF